MSGAAILATDEAGPEHATDASPGAALAACVVAYDADARADFIEEAYAYAAACHEGQKRYSGDPYITHPVAVAQALADMRLDEATIVTALLHDTVEDTGATLEEVRARFGEEVARLVDGVTKLAQIRFTSQKSEQAENFRKLMVAMASDVRVLIVKLADRLHNMRTLSHHPKVEKRRRIAEETLEIFAPLAGRMGMQAIRDELEQLAFEELNARALEAIVQRIGAQTGDQVPAIIAEIESALAAGELDASVSGRRKTPFSIWRKTQTKGLSFEQLSDVFAFRVQVESVDACYRAMGLIHQKWKCVPGRFKDYISVPKPNGYQSLHTTVLGPDNQRVEIQIRTRSMHDIAERGVAAHWRYRDRVDQGDARGFEWLRGLIDMLEQSTDAEEFLEHSKLELFQDQVFCFTPKGRLITLPRGATAIDFAYAVHTEVGDHCVGAKVNGQIVSMRLPLSNGDTVEVLTSDAQGPEAAWEAWAVTGRAKSAIRRFRRHQEREDYRSLGDALLRAAFTEADLPFSEKALEAAAARLKLEDAQMVVERTGRGDITAEAVLNAAFPMSDQSVFAKLARRWRTAGRERDKRANRPPVSIKGLTRGLAVHLAKCCTPLPGDRVVGIVRAGMGLEVHTIDCERLADFDDRPDLWHDVTWTDDANETMTPIGRVRLTLQNGPGALAEVTGVIAHYAGNIVNIKLTERRADYFVSEADLEVEDARHLGAIIAALRVTPLVLKVERVRA